MVRPSAWAALARWLGSPSSSQKPPSGRTSCGWGWVCGDGGGGVGERLVGERLVGGWGQPPPPPHHKHHTPHTTHSTRAPGA